MLLYICFAICKGQTFDLIHKFESSSAVCFILIFSDPDVELVRRMTTVIVVELQALDLAVSFRGHCLAFHFGCISLISALSAEVHEERRPCRQWNWCIVQNWMVQWLQLWLEVRHYFLGNKNSLSSNLNFLSVNKPTLSKKKLHIHRLTVTHLTVLFFAQVCVVIHIGAIHWLHSLPAIISSRTHTHLTQRLIVKTTVIKERDGRICNANKWTNMSGKKKNVFVRNTILPFWYYM